MKKFEKMSKENLISELMQDTIKGGCCKPTWSNTNGGTNNDGTLDGKFLMFQQ